MQELIKLPEVVHDKVAAVLYGMEHELVDPLHFKVTEGTDGKVTSTVTLFVSDPLPLQVSVYVLSEVRLPVDSEPESGLLPDQPPEAVQEPAFVTDHVIVLDVL
mgnify:CR=1 FL=1